MFRSLPRAARARVPFVLHASLACLLAATGPAYAVPATTPGALAVTPTLTCAGFRWVIAGDDDHDCAVTLEYRPAGDPSWRPAQPLLRVHDGLWSHGEDPGPSLAGSLFDLASGSAYEARLTLRDPDGGSEERVVTFTTRAEPRSADERVLRVIPGDGGGAGTVADPFRGLAAADAAARPGDTFLLWPGTYRGTFRPLRDGTAGHPIVWRGLDPASVILDGDPAYTPDPAAAVLDDRQHVFLEGVTVRNARIGIRADRSRGVVLRGCTVRVANQTASIVGIRAGASTDLLIEDDTVWMNGDWANVGRVGAYGYGGYGILVEGSGIVVRHNTVVEAWDAISLPVTDAAVPATFNHDIDVIENLVDRASDDGIQADALHWNVRLMRNRLLNTGSAVSFQPSFGGPGYVIGNEMFNTRIEPYKFHQETFYGWTQETSGLLVYHNTSVSSRNAWYETGIWHDARFRNNLLLGAQPDEASFINGATLFAGDFDHDGWNRVGAPSALIRYNGGSYSTLAAFAAATGNEAHGIEVPLAAFTRAVLPHHPEWNFFETPYGAPYAVGDVDLTLPPGSVAIDRGTPLANVNDGFAGTAPDLGCHESGRPVPEYGARPWVRLADAGPPREGGYPLWAAPLPFSDALTLHFELAGAGPVALEIVDLQGARVRVLVRETLTAGGHTARWDGLGADGRPAPPGVYFARLVAAGHASATRIVRIR